MKRYVNNWMYIAILLLMSKYSNTLNQNTDGDVGGE